jgi:8-oxo-dGTP pyrophosphatase MutT (NUDIX family)
MWYSWFLALVSLANPSERVAKRPRSDSGVDVQDLPSPKRVANTPPSVSSWEDDLRLPEGPVHPTFEIERYAPTDRTKARDQCAARKVFANKLREVHADMIEKAFKGKDPRTASLVLVNQEYMLRDVAMVQINHEEGKHGGEYSVTVPGGKCSGNGSLETAIEEFFSETGYDIPPDSKLTGCYNYHGCAVYVFKTQTGSGLPFDMEAPPTKEAQKEVLKTFWVLKRTLEGALNGHARLAIARDETAPIRRCCIKSLRYGFEQGYI